MEQELNKIRLGYLTLYILKYIRKMPERGMQPFNAMIAQDIENNNNLRAGKSLVFSRLNDLCENGYINSEWGFSSNPKVKKKVKFYSIANKGKDLIKQLELEHKRILAIL